MTAPGPRAAVDADEIDAFTTSLRRRKRIAGLIGLIVILGVGALVALKSAERIPALEPETGQVHALNPAGRLPALDPKAVGHVSEALDHATAESRVRLAARALVELEGERLPSALLGAFAKLSSASPGGEDLVLLAPFAGQEEVVQAWQLACPGGAAILADSIGGGGTPAAVYERCKLDRLGLLKEAELGGVSLGQLVAAHSVWAFLVDHDAHNDIERRVLRALMGRR